MKLIDNNLKSFYVKGRLPQWSIWVIVVLLFSLSWYGVSIWARQAALRDLAKYTDTWTSEGILEQLTTYSCVPAAIVMLLKDEGIDTTTLEIATCAGTDIRGTDGSGIIRTGEQYGFTVQHERLTYEEFMSRGLPGIVIFRYNGIRHAVFISREPGFDLLRVKDSVQGLLHFEKDGADEYFGGKYWDVYLFER